MNLDASENIKATITKIVERIEEKGLTPLIGFEWEFQLLDKHGKPVLFTDDIVKTINEPSIERANLEAGYGAIEITTKPLPPVKAAEALMRIQRKTANWAQANGCHISLGPIVPKSGKWHDSPPDTSHAYGTGLHVNASLVDVANPNKNNSLIYIDSSTDGYKDVQAKTDSRTANIIYGILKVNEETPLWSFHGDMSPLRLTLDGNTPVNYNSDAHKKKAGVTLRSNIEDEIATAESYEYFAKLDSAMGIPGSNENHRQITRELERLNDYKKGIIESDFPYFPARTEERFPESSTDPFVAAFRTVLGQYHGLKIPIDNKYIPVSSINLNNIPIDFQQLQAAHLPNGGIISAYVGELYDEATLREIDKRGKKPPITDRESKKFKPEFSTASPINTHQGAILPRDVLKHVSWGQLANITQAYSSQNL